MEDGFLLFAGTDGEEAAVVLQGVDGVDFGRENLVVAVENLGCRTLLVEIGVGFLLFLLLLLVLVAEVPEHVLEIAGAFVLFVATRVFDCVALALGEG